VTENFNYDADIAAAFVSACEGELQALKPGNVHIHAAGHGMTVDDFRASARAAAPFIASRDLGLGERIHLAVNASLTAAKQNTNLGILLLCAPLALASETAAKGEPLKMSLRHVLARLDANDAAQVFAAIAAANPGGLGNRDRGDVRAPPSMALLEAMELAAGYDRIARAYISNFDDVFDFGLPYLESLANKLTGSPLTVSALFLKFLSAFPDSHVMRKFGSSAAEQVRVEAASVEADFWNAGPGNGHAILEAFDTRLKHKGLNPGTSADFTVATLFAQRLTKMKRIT